ncbi:MAG: prolyl oligopeptidase family serine peptidase, partial [Acidimicrobiia bacterium]
RQSEEHRVLTEEWDRSAAGWEFDSRGDLVLVAEEDGRQHLFRMPLGGGTPVLLAEGGTLDSPLPDPDGAVFVLHQSLSAPPEVARLGGDGGLEAVTDFNGGLLSELGLGDVEDVRFPGWEGVEIQMFVVYPPGFDPARRWPLVHMIHGGPHGTFGDAFHFRWNAHAFASPGYVVALVNFHGSTSFGQAFAASIHGEWGDKPTADMLAATDHLVEQGLIDQERMAITGGSYGGYLTAWLTTQTDRFACAVAHAAVTDLPGMYASDITFGRARSYGAEIWEDRELVERWSPSAHAAGYSTPTLVIHGERDYRVPLTQGLELYGVLKAKGVEARLVYYPDENHWVLSPQNSLHWYGEVLGWLGRHLAGRVSYALGGA